MKTQQKTVRLYIADDGTRHESLEWAKIADALHLLAQLGYDQSMSMSAFVKQALLDEHLVFIIKPRNSPQRSLI
jgi:hypothetical protein